jgi:hypothetical protein
MLRFALIAMKKPLVQLLGVGLLAGTFLTFAQTTYAAEDLAPIVEPALTLPSLAGNYELLLLSTENGSSLPAGLLTLKALSNGTFTGSLLALDTKRYPLAGKLRIAGDFAEIRPATSTGLPQLLISRGKDENKVPLPSYVLALSLRSTGLSATLTSGAFSASGSDSLKIVPPVLAADSTLPGRYTLPLAEPTPVTEGQDVAYPTGSGYFTGTIDKKGKLSLAGSLADGTKITSSLSPNAELNYRLFLNPYATRTSYLGGSFTLRQDKGGAYTVGRGAELFWRKAAALKPRAYVDGFGPLGVSFTFNRWTPPAAGQTLAAALGATDLQFDFSLGEINGLDLAETYVGRVPTRLKIVKLNTTPAQTVLVPVLGDEFSPATQAAWAKFWNVKLDPTTGAYTGTLKVRDILQSAGVINGNDQRYLPAKFITREIKIAGVLLRRFALSEGEDPFNAEGYFTLAAADPKIGFLQAGDVDLADSFEPVGTGAPLPGTIPPGTAGNYTALIRRELFPLDFSGIGAGSGVVITSQERMSGLIADQATIPLKIEGDLSVLTFNGRKIPLAVDGRVRVNDQFGGSLIYADTTKPGAKTPKKNSIVVTVYIGFDGRVTGFGVLNLQLLKANYRITIPGFGTQNLSAFFPGVVLYSSNGTPTKVSAF